MDRRALGGKAPGEEGAAVHGVFEPRVEFVGDVAVEEDLDGLFEFAGEFADLQIADVGGRFPVHVTGTLEGLVGAYAIEVAAESAIVRFDFAGDAGEQIVKPGLRIDSGVDHHLAGEGDARGFFEETEGEGGGEGEAVLAICASPWKADVDDGVERGTGGDQGKVDARFHGGASLFANGLDVDGKGWKEPFVIADEEACRHAPSGGDVIGYLEIEFQSGEAQAANQAADQQSRHHGGDDE